LHRLPCDLNEWKILREQFKEQIINESGVVTDHDLPLDIHETGDDKFIPLLYLTPGNKSNGYVIITNPGGKDFVSMELIADLQEEGFGLVVADLSGTGEVKSTASVEYDQLAGLHTMARSELWLGKTVLGEWVSELAIIKDFLISGYNADKIILDGTAEAGLAGLFLGALDENVDDIVLRNSPVSYLFDERESVDYFSMGIHLPGFLEWGDISLAAALSGTNVTFYQPVTMSGKELGEDELKAFHQEYDNMMKVCGSSGRTFFVSSENWQRIH
jgi:hypothetical protein